MGESLGVLNVRESPLIFRDGEKQDDLLELIFYCLPPALDVLETLLEYFLGVS